MEKPSVTIKHTENYLFGGVVMLFSVIAIVPNLSAPAADQVVGWIWIGCQFVLGLIILGCGDAMEIIDENGIYMKGFVKEHRYAWTDIVEVGVAKVRRGRTARYGPEIYITLPGGTPRRAAGEQWILRNLRTGLTLSYGRKIWDCICYHYGAPDFDEWGKPPEIS